MKTLNSSIIKETVVGRILRYLAPKIPIPGLHTLYTPLTLNVGRTCEYDDTLLLYYYCIQQR